MNRRETDHNRNNDEFVMKPKVDFCFKELMEDEEIRRGFLSAVLEVPKESIQETVLLPAYLRKEYEDDKLGILDVRVILKDRTQIDIEIQITAFAFWIERSIYYLCKMYTGQIRKGEEYEVLKKCIHIGILNFTMFDKSKEFASCFHLWEDKRREKYSDKLELHVLELPKLRKNEYPETELLNWVKFINAEKKEEMEKMAQTDESLKKAYERVLELSADEQKRLEYEAREKALMDYNSQMKSNWKAGYKAGAEEGYKTGTEEGHREGHKAGVAEGVVGIYQRLGKTKDTAVKTLVEQFSMDIGEAEQKVQEFWQEY